MAADYGLRFHGDRVRVGSKGQLQDRWVILTRQTHMLRVFDTCIVNLMAAERYIPKNLVAAASNNVLSLQFALHAAFFAFSASWIVPSYVSWMFPLRASTAYFYPDGPSLPARISERHLFSRLFAMWIGLCYAL